MSEDTGTSQVVCGVKVVSEKAITARKNNFKKVSKRCGKLSTRSSEYYTSAEKPIKKALEKLGLVENYHYFHNVKIKTKAPSGKTTYFWVDFMVPNWNMAIECSPAMWHNLKKRIESDLRKKSEVMSHGFNYAIFNGKDIRRLKKEDFSKVLIEVLMKDGQDFRGTKRE